MPEPVVEQIMANVRSRVATVFVSHRSTRVATWQPKDATVHVYQGAITPIPELMCPGNPAAMAYSVEAIVAGLVKPSDRDTTPVDTYRNRMGADIIKAITEPDMWHQWTGLAIDTVIGPVEEYTEETGGLPGVIVRLTITYRVSENDPYEVRA